MNKNREYLGVLGQDFEGKNYNVRVKKLPLIKM